MLAHGDPGAGHDERGQGGDVDAVAPVAARAHDVDRPSGQVRRAAVTRLAAASMASSIPFSSSTVSPFMRRATTKAPSWAGRGLAGQDLVHGRAGGVGGQVLAGDEVAEDRGPAAEVRQRLPWRAAQAERRRWRMIRRRSRSVQPPQTPCFSRRCSACSRQADADAARAADRLCAVRLLVGLGVEDPGVQPPARPQLPPVDVLYRHGSPPKAGRSGGRMAEGDAS